jgi:hypothetical protein
VDGPGAFRVSKDIGRQHIRQFNLCSVCVQDPEAVEKLKRWNLLVDFQSVTGKFLPGLGLRLTEEVKERTRKRNRSIATLAAAGDT